MSIDCEPEIIFKWTNLCRLCLSSDSYIDLFSSDVISEECLSKIRSCLNLLVYYGDPMPAKICEKCHLKLDEWCKFRKECIQAESNIKKRLHPYKDIKFVKEYFERCAKFESSEIVSSSSKSNCNSGQNFEEVNSSVSAQEYQEDIVILPSNKKPFASSSPSSSSSSSSSSLSSVGGHKKISNSGTKTKKQQKNFGKVKRKRNQSRTSVIDINEDPNVKKNSGKKEKDWGSSESGSLGTIVSVTGSASALWDTQDHMKQNEEANSFFGSHENYNKSEERNKPNQFDYLQEKTCPNCGMEFSTEEDFEVHTCCMIGSSTHLEEEEEEEDDDDDGGDDDDDQEIEEGHFEDSISMGSECDGTESFSVEDQQVVGAGAEHPFFKVRITPWKCIPCNLYYRSCLELRRHYYSISCLGKKARALSCEFCYRRFLSLNDLLEHQVVHIIIKLDLTEDDLICCNKCSQQFPDERRFKNHLVMHALKQKTPIKYTCFCCNQVFFQKELFESHLETHDQTQKASEGQSEPAEAALSPPLDAPSTLDVEPSPNEPPRKQGGAIRCFRCGQMFASVKQLEHHEATRHKNPTPFICRKCGLRFSARSQLLMHLRVHMTKSSSKSSPKADASEQGNTCTQCDAKFLLESDLESHMKTHKLPKSEPSSPATPQPAEETESSSGMFARYKCSLCSRLYVRASSCIRHGQQSHKGEKVVPLRLKRTVFLGRRTSLPPGGKVKHKCPKCPKYFFSFNAFSIHTYKNHGLKMPNLSEDPANMETVETPESPKPEEMESKCPFCAKDIKPSYISLHIKKFHRGEVLDPSLIDQDIPTDSCICRYCLKTCSTPHNRKLHESIHYPVKAQKNQCETCGQKFPDKTFYEDHIRTCKSIRCGKCNKLFFKFISLTQHSCTGSKNDETHKCTVCLSAFTSLDLLQIHIKNFHGKKPEAANSPQPGTSRNAAKRLERELWREESNKIVCMVGEKFYCTFCDCEFSTIQESNEHRAVHPRGNWYAVQISDCLFQCTICDKFFETRKSSLLHINYHKKNLMPEQPKPLQLSLEPEVEIFTDIKASETSKPRKYNCRYCSAAFRDQEDLQEHLFQAHVNQT